MTRAPVCPPLIPPLSLLCCLLSFSYPFSNVFYLTQPPVIRLSKPLSESCAWKSDSHQFIIEFIFSLAKGLLAPQVLPSKMYLLLLLSKALSSLPSPPLCCLPLSPLASQHLLTLFRCTVVDVDEYDGKERVDPFPLSLLVGCSPQVLCLLCGLSFPWRTRSPASSLSSLLLSSPPFVLRTASSLRTSLMWPFLRKAFSIVNAYALRTAAGGRLLQVVLSARSSI